MASRSLPAGRRTLGNLFEKSRRRDGKFSSVRKDSAFKKRRIPPTLLLRIKASFLGKKAAIRAIDLSTLTRSSLMGSPTGARRS